MQCRWKLLVLSCGRRQQDTKNATWFKRCSVRAFGNRNRREVTTTCRLQTVPSLHDILFVGYSTSCSATGTDRSTRRPSPEVAASRGRARAFARGPSVKEFALLAQHMLLICLPYPVAISRFAGPYRVQGVVMAMLHSFCYEGRLGRANIYYIQPPP